MVNMEDHFLSVRWIQSKFIKIIFDFALISMNKLDTVFVHLFKFIRCPIEAALAYT